MGESQPRLQFAIFCNDLITRLALLIRCEYCVKSISISTLPTSYYDYMMKSSWFQQLLKFHGIVFSSSETIEIISFCESLIDVAEWIPEFLKLFKFAVHLSFP